jgi:hypothetical protein
MYLVVTCQRLVTVDDWLSYKPRVTLANGIFRVFRLSSIVATSSIASARFTLLKYRRGENETWTKHPFRFPTFCLAIFLLTQLDTSFRFCLSLDTTRVLLRPWLPFHWNRRLTICYNPHQAWMDGGSGHWLPFLYSNPSLSLLSENRYGSAYFRRRRTVLLFQFSFSVIHLFPIRLCHGNIPQCPSGTLWSFTTPTSLIGWNFLFVG